MSSSTIDRSVASAALVVGTDPVASSNNNDTCICWVNLNSRWGDGQLHVNELSALNDTIPGIMCDIYPQSVFDGYFCIDESQKGRNNFAKIRELIAQNLGRFVGTMEKMFRDGSDHKGLIDHPLLHMNNVEEQLGQELVQYLRQVKCFVVSESFDVFLQHAGTELIKHGERMRALIA